MAAWEATLAELVASSMPLLSIVKTRVSHLAQGNSVEAGHSHGQVGQHGQKRYHADEQPGGAAATWQAAAIA